jgi:hypothetical protein
MKAKRRDSQKLRLLMMALLIGVIGSCVDSSEPNSPPASTATTGIDAALQVSPARGIDAEFTRLARGIPGFGGMYYDRSGRLNVYITRTQGGAAARSADVTGRLRALGGAGVRHRLQSAAVTIREAQYDYAQLQSWKARLGKIFTVKGVVYTDIDEETNRISVALTPAASQVAVERILRAAAVPLGAVSFRRMPVIRQLQTVQDRLRPVPGGAQIVFPAAGNVFFVCTVGFNAQLHGQPGMRLFVTASHCSQTQGGNQNTPYYQPIPGPSSPATNRVAFEFRDPQYGNPGGQCYEGFRCRLSDALLARYQESRGGILTQIARTTFGLTRIGSIIIDPNNPRWEIVREFEFPFLGETAHKVGRTSGWTRGPVIATCVDVQSSGTDIIQLCQDIVLAGSSGGDSGAGVFERLNSASDVALIGILWGGGTDSNGAPIFVLSPMENIEFELGRMITSEDPEF